MNEPDHEGDRYFPYRLDRRFRPMLAALGVKDTDGVTLTADDQLVVTFGRKRVETPLANVDHTLRTGPHRWWTAVGLRLSFADDGLTMGTNFEAGLCIAFVEKIPKVLGLRDHSALWVSVSDPDALAEAIGR